MTKSASRYTLIPLKLNWTWVSVTFAVQEEGPVPISETHCNSELVTMMMMMMMITATQVAKS